MLRSHWEGLAETCMCSQVHACTQPAQPHKHCSVGSQAKVRQGCTRVWELLKIILSLERRACALHNGDQLCEECRWAKEPKERRGVQCPSPPQQCSPRCTTSLSTACGQRGDGDLALEAPHPESKNRSGTTVCFCEQDRPLWSPIKLF